MRKIKFDKLSKFEASKVRGGESTGGSCATLCEAGSNQGYEAHKKKQQTKETVPE